MPVFPQLFAFCQGGVCLGKGFITLVSAYEHIHVSVIAIPAVKCLKIIIEHAFQILGYKICYIGMVEIHILHLWQFLQLSLYLIVEQLARQFYGMKFEIVLAKGFVALGIAICPSGAVAIGKGYFYLSKGCIAVGKVGKLFCLVDFLLQILQIAFSLNEILFIEFDSVFGAFHQHRIKEWMRGFRCALREIGGFKHALEIIEVVSLNRVVKSGYRCLHHAII